MTLKSIKDLIAKKIAGVGASDEEKEYSFVWYYKMHLKNESAAGTTIYDSHTKPFRVKIKGRSYQDAHDKLMEFALSKCSVIILNEDEYRESAHAKAGAAEKGVFKGVDEVFKRMDDLFKKF